MAGLQTYGTKELWYYSTLVLLYSVVVEKMAVLVYEK